MPDDARREKEAEMDYWDTSDADDRRGSPAGRRWAGHVRGFVAGVAITSLAAFLLVHGRSTDAQTLRVGGASDTAETVISATTTTERSVAPSTTSTSPAQPVDTTEAPTPPSSPSSVRSNANVLPASTTTITVSSPTDPTPTSTPELAERDALATCSDPEQGVASTPTQDEFVGRLVGTWVACDAASVFGTNEVGMQIGSDGRWSKLARNPAGQLTPMPGWGNGGTWDVTDTSAMNGPGVFQVDFHIDGSGTVISVPVFSSGPPKMRLNNMGVYLADYVPIPESAGR